MVLKETSHTVPSFSSCTVARFRFLLAWRACHHIHRRNRPAQQRKNGNSPSTFLVRATFQGKDGQSALSQQGSQQQLRELDERWEDWSWDASSEADSHTLQTAISTLVEAARLVAPLRKQEREFQVANVRCVGGLVEAVCSEAHRPMLQSMGADRVALLTESICVLGGRLRFLQPVDHLLEILEPDVGALDLTRVAVLVYRLAESDHWAPLLNALSMRAGELCWRLTPNQFVVLLRGFARLNSVPHHLLTTKCVNHIEKRVMGKLTVPLLINSLWCLTVLKQTQHRLFTSLWGALCKVEEAGMELSRSQLTQMHQVGLSLKFEPRLGCPYLPPSRILKAAQDTNSTALYGVPPTVSSYQRSVATCLTSMGKAFQEETTCTGLPLDVLLPEDNLAIEVDGPIHFTRTSRQPLGSMALKRRLISAMGMKLVSVTIEEWDSLAGLAEQREFLGQAIERQLRA